MVSEFMCMERIAQYKEVPIKRLLNWDSQFDKLAVGIFNLTI